MRHATYVLKPAAIDTAKAKDKRYNLTDGGGLVLEVMPSGTKTWRFKYHLAVGSERPVAPPASVLRDRSGGTRVSKIFDVCLS